jgi:Kef-type K+ transport system membrane component KefB
MALMESDTEFLHVIISLAILLFTAKIFAEIFHRLKMPIVLGELLAGIIMGATKLAKKYGSGLYISSLEQYMTKGTQIF